MRCRHFQAALPAFAAAALSGAPRTAPAQAAQQAPAPAAPAATRWPERSVRLVLPLGAGNSLDHLARLLAECFSAGLQQTVVALRENAVRDWAAAGGVQLVGNEPTEFAARIRAELVKWVRVKRVNR